MEQLNKPPVGTFEHTDRGDLHYVEWSPGNGTRYRMIVVDLFSENANDGMVDAIGGELVVSIAKLDGQRGYTSYGMHSGGLYMADYVASVFGQGAVDQDVTMVTCLLNWTLSKGAAKTYAQELWDEAGEKWKIVKKVS